MTERLDATVEPAGRARRLAAAAGATMLVPAAGLLVVAVGRGRMLEDACITEPPATWAPELTVVRGPVPEGLVTFRCVQVASGDAFVFTDARPLVLSVVVVAAAVVMLALLWAWALRRPAATDAQPLPRSAGLSAG